MSAEKRVSKTLEPGVDRNFDWCNRDHTLAYISNLCKRIDRKKNNEKMKVIKSTIQESRDLVLLKARKKARTSVDRHTFLFNNEDFQLDHNSALPLLPSHSERFVDNSTPIGRYKHKVRLLKSKRWRTHQVTKPVEFKAATTERPISKSTVFLKSNYAAEDERDLKFAPYFGEEDEEDEVLSELFDTKKRENLLDSGPEYIEKERNEYIDEILDIVMGKVEERQAAIPQTRFRNESINLERIMFRVQDHLANVKGISHTQIRQRYILKCEPKISEMMNGMSSHPSDENTPGSSCSPVTPNKSFVKNSELSTEKSVQYEDVMDSFRHLFCRRCFTYDCLLHGIVEQSNLPVQTMLAVRKERNGGWEYDSPDMCVLEHSRTASNTGEVNADDFRLTKEKGSELEKKNIKRTCNLNTLQKSLCQHAYQTFQGDLNKIASVLKASVEDIKEQVKEQNIKFEEHENQFCQIVGTADGKSKRKKRKYDESSMNKFDHAWLKRVQQAEIHPAFEPCAHVEPCSEGTCSCVQNAFFCTKHCLWGKESRYFFPGCRCKRGECRQKSCPCFAAGRECDPDICRDCGACCDEADKLAVRQKCRNDSISMRRHCQLLVAKSPVEGAGWGVYNKTALKKGDFVHEYIGEVISQEEADRRGCIYDKVNRSYLFNLTSETCVDASRKGNKTKFLNHSSNPNCYAKVLTVNGDSRIGIFAKEDIDPQSELFFDYRYDVSMNNDLIVKPAMEVSWMKKKKAHKKHAK